MKPEAQFQQQGDVRLFDKPQLLYSHICYVVASNFHDDLRTFFTNKKIPIFFPGTGKCVKNAQ